MKLSIITINRNNAAGLRKTMESVFAQTYRDFEYIVVDGASTDESVEVIREYDSINHSSVHPLTFTWLSEPDTGIYNAMNKGIRMSKGEYSLLLNSGDCLAENDVIKRVLPELHTDDIVHGCMYMFQKKPHNLVRGIGETKLSFFDVCDGDFLHQAAFIRKDVYKRCGYYDESYKIVGDTAFFIKVVGLCNVSFRVIDIPISIFEGGGVASSKDEKILQIKHGEYIRIEHEILGERLTNLYRENYKKIKLYDKLHANQLSWYMTMAIVHIFDFFHNSK